MIFGNQNILYTNLVNAAVTSQKESRVFQPAGLLYWAWCIGSCRKGAGLYSHHCNVLAVHLLVHYNALRALWFLVRVGNAAHQPPPAWLIAQRLRR